MPLCGHLALSLPNGMSNHYHLMIETPEANLVAGMRWFAPAFARALSRKASAQTTWTMRYNRRHRLSGHLFQGRYKAARPSNLPPLVPSASSVVDSQEGRYFAVLSDYIHLNPVRARMIGLEERLFDYPWSSYPLYAARKGRPVWFEPRTVLGEMGLEDTAAGRRAYAERMRDRAVDELARKHEPAELSELRRGWCLGGEGFRERMLRLLDAAAEKLPRRRLSPRDASVQRDHGMDEARRLLEEGLRCLGVERDELARLKKSDPRKAALAVRIRTSTTVPNAWIAEQLQLGHVSRVTHCARTAPPELLRKLECAVAK